MNTFIGLLLLFFTLFTTITFILKQLYNVYTKIWHKDNVYYIAVGFICFLWTLLFWYYN